SAREASKVGPAMRSQLLRAYLVQRTALWEPPASLTATSRATSCSSASSTHRDTSPIRSASSPDTGSHSSRGDLGLAMPHSSGPSKAGGGPGGPPQGGVAVNAPGQRGGYRDVGKQADDQPGPDRRAGHGRDHRLGAVDEVVVQVAGLAEAAAADPRGARP